MPGTMTCKHCGTALNAETEDELVPMVQAHAASHPGGPELSREHVLSHLHRLQNRTHPAE